jgi:hypothetical protein
VFPVLFSSALLAGCGGGGGDGGSPGLCAVDRGLSIEQPTNAPTWSVSKRTLQIGEGRLLSLRA